MKKQVEMAVQAAHQAGRAVVLHTLVNGLLATQCLSKREVIAFFEAICAVLEEEVTNTGHIEGVLREAGFDRPVNRTIVNAFREAIELQIRLIETETSKTPVAP